MRRYIRANADDDYEIFKQFQRELDKIRKDFYAKYPKRKYGVDIFDDVDFNNDNRLYAGVNWGAWGTQPPEDARMFAEALMYAIELCEDLNSRYPNLKDY